MNQKSFEDTKFNIITDATNLFDETASTTYKKKDGEFFLGYIGASVNGTDAEETVSVI